MQGWWQAAEEQLQRQQAELLALRRRTAAQSAWEANSTSSDSSTEGLRRPMAPKHAQAMVRILCSLIRRGCLQVMQFWDFSGCFSVMNWSLVILAGSRHLYLVLHAAMFDCYWSAMEHTPAAGAFVLGKGSVCRERSISGESGRVCSDQGREHLEQNQAHQMKAVAMN